MSSVFLFIKLAFLGTNADGSQTLEIPEVEFYMREMRSFYRELGPEA